MQRRQTFLTGILFILIFTSCNPGATEKSEIKEPQNHSILGVSVWDRIAARSEPSRNSTRVSLLSLGESFVYLDSSAIDSSYNNTRFLKVRLSDSTEVWAYDFASVLHAKPAVITKEVPLYLRPDLLTITDTRMKIMEIVAVLEEWDDWIKIVNEKKENTGWIKKEFLTYNAIDLAFALLVKRNMEAEEMEQKIDNLESLLENNPYPGSVFISDLKILIDQQKELLRKNEEERDRENRDERERNR